ncbi:MAG: hypothetical protein P8Z68_06910 [Kineosporiaceae bacterium]
MSRGGAGRKASNRSAAARAGRAPDAGAPVPLERGRATAVLSGLGLFTVGFAVAGALSLVGAGGSPGYLAVVGLGFAGIGVVGFFLNRGTVPLPEGAIWMPIGLRALARAVGLPGGAVLAVIYGLAVFGITANVVVPLVLGR